MVATFVLDSGPQYRHVSDTVCVCRGGEGMVFGPIDLKSWFSSYLAVKNISVAVWFPDPHYGTERLAEGLGMMRLTK